jgi:hypothetical protein
VRRKYKREARASILSFIYDYHFDIWLLASEPMPWGFEGFDLTNPRGQFGGEIFHLACSKLGLGDEIIPHTILLQIYLVPGWFYINHRYTRREGSPLGGFQQGGHNCETRTIRFG